MLSLWQGVEPCFRRPPSGESERRIFRINPAKKRTTFFGSRRNQCHARWRWEKRDRWRINNLKNVETESVRHQRKDRKSTRLNSSHRCISYAVFCLKKKKKQKK